MDSGLEILAMVKAKVGVPVLSDVHLPEQCAAAAEVLDVIQIPAFCVNRLDLLVEAAKTGCVINVKKDSFWHHGIWKMLQQKLPRLAMINCC